MVSLLRPDHGQCISREQLEWQKQLPLCLREQEHVQSVWNLRGFWLLRPADSAPQGF